jgi:hypothetical protein
MKDNIRRGVRRLRNTANGTVGAELAELRRQVRQLEEDVAESRRLNERLSDVLDVLVELLVPAVDRDDARLAAGLQKLGTKVPDVLPENQG